MKVAIIGNGIVGATCAYYLGKEKGFEIDVYDDQKYTGTRAAVGIICPWVTQRRNKAWYELVESGANFYHKLAKDLGTNAFMRKTGAIIIHEKLHDKLLKIAQDRLQTNPIMKSVKEVSNIPNEFAYEKGIFVEGAFSIDGLEYLKLINKHTPQTNFIDKTVTLKEVLSMDYDKIIIASGARIESLLDDLNIKLDHSAQKGMLLEYGYQKNDHPIIMPQGEIDFLFKDQSLVIGASHENQYKHLEYDENIAQDLIAQARKYLPLKENHTGYRIGLRSQNSKNLPFFGSLKENPNIYCIGGLGSSGLTSGPYIAYLISQHLIYHTKLDERYDVNQFVL